MAIAPLLQSARTSLAGLRPHEYTQTTVQRIPGGSEAAETLLSAGAEMEARDKRGMTPFLSCMEYQEDLSFAGFLLDRGANFNAQDAQGRTILMMQLARTTADQDKLWTWFLRYKPDLELKDEHGDTILLKASTGIDPRRNWVDLLLKAGAQIHARNLKGETVLHRACSLTWGNKTVEQLAKAGADPNARDHAGMTPLHHAVVASRDSMKTKAAVTVAILRAGGKVGQADLHGSTPLSLAAACGNHPAVEILLAAGSPVSTKDMDGDTPFADAILHNHFRIAHRLLDAGATVEEAYRGNWNALSAAIKGGNRNAWEEVKKGNALEAMKGRAGIPNAWSWMAFGVAAMKGDIGFFEGAEKLGIELPQPDTSAQPSGPYHHPLMLLAAAFGQSELLNVMQRKRPVMFPAKDVWGRTLGSMTVGETSAADFSRYLSWEARHPALATAAGDLMNEAARNGLTSIVELLLRRGPKGEFINGPQAADLLDQAAAEEHWDTVRLLLKAGGTPSIRKQQAGEPVPGSFWDQAFQQHLSEKEIVELILLNPRAIELPCTLYGRVLWSDPILGSPSVVRRLLAGGITPSAFLKAPSGSLNNPIVQGRAHPEVTGLILGKSIPAIDDLDADGLPAIAKARSAEALTGLLDRGATAAWKGKDGKRHYLLHHLLDNAENGAELVIAFLGRPEAGPQVRLTDGQGRLALGIVAGLHPTAPWCGTGYDGEAHLKRVRSTAGQIISLLLKAGARADVPDAKGVTPLEVAAGNDFMIFSAMRDCLGPLSSAMTRKLLIAAMRSGNVPVMNALVSDRAHLDAKWPWSEWMAETLGKTHPNNFSITRALVDSGFIPLAKRREAYWDIAFAWNAELLAMALDLGNLKPDSASLSLLEAAKNGTVADVQAALGAAPVDARDEQGRTALMMASGAGRIEVVKLLLKAGAKANARSLGNEGALYLALKARHEDIAAVLIRDGKADPNRGGPNGMPPLVRAIRDRDHAAVFFLTHHGVNPRSEQYQTVGNAPLNAAAQMGDLEMVQYLVTECCMNPSLDQTLHDSNWKLWPKGTTGITINDANGQYIGFNTPLVAALTANQARVVAWLLKQGVPVTDTKDNSLLYDLVAQNRVELIRLIGPRMSASAYSKQLAFEWEHQAPILHAIEKGNVEVLKVLLESGFPPQQRCRNGMNGLHLACIKNQPEALRLLLDTRQMPLNQAGGDYWGDTRPPLLTAVLYNRPECVEALLQAGANPREVIMDHANRQIDGPGQTLIHWACRTYNRKDSKVSLRPLIRLLVEKAGLDINQRRDSDGLTALDLATGPGNAELAEILRDYGGRRGEELGPLNKSSR